MIWLKRNVKPILHENEKGDRMIYGDSLSFYYDIELIYKCLKKRVSDSIGEEKDLNRNILRTFVILQVLNGLAFANITILPTIY